MFDSDLVTFATSSIGKGVTLAYGFIMATTLTLDLDLKTIISILAVLLANLLALLKWGIKVEKSLAHTDAKVEAINEKIDYLRDLLKDRNE